MKSIQKTLEPITKNPRKNPRYIFKLSLQGIMVGIFAGLMVSLYRFLLYGSENVLRYYLPLIKSNTLNIILFFIVLSIMGILIDYLTKWVEAEPTKYIESEDVIRFLSKVFSRHGIPELIVTDNGPQFNSDKTKAFLDLYGVYVHFVATYHPESNGEVENRNKEIGKYPHIFPSII